MGGKKRETKKKEKAKEDEVSISNEDDICDKQSKQELESNPSPEGSPPKKL
jgi:hypothetical protein